MQFNSHIFILCFLPLTLTAYFLCGRYLSHKLSKVILIAASLLFIGHANLSSVCILIVSIMINYLISRRIHLSISNTRKFYLFIGLIINIVMLSFFKYANVVISSIQTAYDTQFPLKNIILPLGISFYTFQQITYLVDVYKEEAFPNCFSDYMLSVCFFPKLIQGPICSFNSLAKQFAAPQNRIFNSDNLAKGLYIFAIGLSKKVLLADSYGKIADYGYTHISSLNSFEAVLVIFSYTFQLYFDFSGYCDMAVGIGKMFNINIPQNFNSPYKALNISDFWKRWHITLTQFLTGYIYIPLGGSRNGHVRTYVNILIVYLISGLWHGTGYTFLVWGIMHGIALILYRIFQKYYDRFPHPLQWTLTFIYINITWIFFRAANLSDAAAIFRKVFDNDWHFYINAELTETLLQPTFISVASRFLTLPVVVLLACAATLFLLLKAKNTIKKAAVFKPSYLNLFIVYLLLFISIVSLSGVSTFLYTNF